MRFRRYPAEDRSIFSVKILERNYSKGKLLSTRLLSSRCTVISSRRTFSRPKRKETFLLGDPVSYHDFGPYQHFEIKINGAQCLLRLVASNAKYRRGRRELQGNLALTTREKFHGLVYRHFLEPAPEASTNPYHSGSQC